jgi:hypothetical protein
MPPTPTPWRPYRDPHAGRSPSPDSYMPQKYRLYETYVIDNNTPARPIARLFPPEPNRFHTFCASPCTRHWRLAQLIGGMNISYGRACASQAAKLPLLTSPAWCGTPSPARTVTWRELAGQASRWSGALLPLQPTWRQCFCAPRPSLLRQHARPDRCQQPADVRTEARGTSGTWLAAAVSGVTDGHPARCTSHRAREGADRPPPRASHPPD